jgi:hypothetical protein
LWALQRVLVNKLSLTHWHPTVNVVELDICAAARWRAS